MAVNKRFLKKLKKFLGPEHVKSGAEDLIAYSRDATLYEALPDVVAHPGSVSEVVDLVRAAAEEGVPVVPRGAGTGLSGGSVAARGGVILHFDRMNRIKEVDRGNMVAEVEPGVINRELKQAAAAAGLFYPPDPSSLRICTIGGNVAENAGGPYGVKYGVTGDYVLGLEAVLSSGKVIRTGGKVRRDVSGYDLTSLLVGSEGTLAIVTGITVKLLPQPVARRAAIFAFDELEAAGEAVVALGAGGIAPAALEIMDRSAIECAEQFRPGKLPRGAAALLLVEVHGEPSSVEAQMDIAASIFRQAKGCPVGEAASGDDVEELWESRRAVSGALARMGPQKIGEDVCVPVSRIPEMVERIKDIAHRHGLTIVIFGHAGDGNLHPNILTDRRDPEMMKKTEAAIADLFQASVELGGTLSGEHGVGMAKAAYMRHAATGETLAAMQKIKQALDPAGIMNPGKIFPEELPEDVFSGSAADELPDADDRGDNH